MWWEEKLGVERLDTYQEDPGSEPCRENVPRVTREKDLAARKYVETCRPGTKVLVVQSHGYGFLGTILAASLDNRILYKLPSL